MFEIYLITNQINENKYVGQCIQGLKKRLRRHINDAKSGSALYLHRAMRKYGYDRFTICLLATAKDQDDLNRLEMLWIKLLETRTHGIGYNMTDGGGGVKGLVQSPETRAKKSRALKGKNIGKQVGEKSCRFRHDIDTDRLVELYNSGKSTDQISTLLGVKKETITSRLLASGIKLRSNREAQKIKCSDPERTPSYRKEILTEEMIPLFEQGWTYQAIGDKLGCSKRCVLLRLRKLGISRPPRRCNLDKDEVVRVYSVWGSLQGIASMFGVSTGTIDLILREKGIPRTNRGKFSRPIPLPPEVAQVSL